MPSLVASQGGAAPLVASVWINWQPKRTNTILGQSWTHLFGADTLCFDLGGGPSRPIFTHPGAFLQVRRATPVGAVYMVYVNSPGEGNRTCSG